MSWPPPDDPLVRLARPLVGTLLALLLSLLLAALIGGALPLDYGGRAAVYLALLLYAIVGAVLVFRAAHAGEHQPLTAGRIVKWTASIWLWPLLLLRRPRTRPPVSGDGP